MKRLLFSFALLLLIGGGCASTGSSGKLVINDTIGDYAPTGKVDIHHTYEGMTATFAGESLDYVSDIRQASVMVLRDEVSRKAPLDEVAAIIADEEEDAEPFLGLFVNSGWVYYQNHGSDALSSCVVMWPSGQHMVVVSGVACNVESDDLWRGYVNKYTPSSTNLTAK